MNFLLVILILGFCVSAFVALGLVFAISAINDGSFGGFEGQAADAAER